MAFWIVPVSITSLPSLIHHFPKINQPGQSTRFDEKETSQSFDSTKCAFLEAEGLGQSGACGISTAGPRQGLFCAPGQRQSVPARWGQCLSNTSSGSSDWLAVRQAHPVTGQPRLLATSHPTPLTPSFGKQLDGSEINHETRLSALSWPPGTHGVRHSQILDLVLMRSKDSEASMAFGDEQISWVLVPSWMALDKSHTFQSFGFPICEMAQQWFTYRC